MVTFEVMEIVLNSPLVNPYSAFKKALIKSLGMSQEQRTKHLLEHEEMGDHKSDQFLRHLQHLAGTAMGDEGVRTLWVSRLPTNMQDIFATQKEFAFSQAD